MTLPCPGLECCDSIFELCEQILPPNPPGELTVEFSEALAECLCVGDEYTVTVVPTDGTAPFTFSVFSGALPIGLSLDVNTGVISGTVTGAGNYTFTILVTDTNGTTGTIIGTIGVIGITTTAIPNYIIGEAYSFQLVAAGGSGNYLFIVVSGTLPTGLTLSLDGLLSGTSNDVYTDVPIVFGVVDAECPFVPLEACGDDLCEVCIGSGLGLFAEGCEGVPPYTYTISAGALPDGITLDEATGEFLGVTTIAGSFSFTVLITDLLGNTATQSYTIGVLQITSLLVQDIIVNVPYSLQLEAIGGSGVYLWTIISGALPDGLSMDTAGLITGTPTVDDDVTVGFSVTDANCGVVPPPEDGVLVDHDGNPIVDEDGNPIGLYP